MKTTQFRSMLMSNVAFLFFTLGQFGCGEALDSATSTDTSVEEARKHRDMRGPSPDLRGPSPDLRGPSPDLRGGPTPNPPPASCDQRHPGVTAIQVVVRVDEYQGLIHGFNGDHEIVYGTVTDTVWVYAGGIVDTGNVQLAINVSSAKDPSGLPHEIPLSIGQSLQVEGEYIPASTANAKDKKGAAAVIHYTHTPCGFTIINGTQYN